VQGHKCYFSSLLPRIKFNPLALVVRAQPTILLNAEVSNMQPTRAFCVAPDAFRELSND